jgi:hypothetical protein
MSEAQGRHVAMAGEPIREGLHGVTPYLIARGAADIWYVATSRRKEDPR